MKKGQNYKSWDISLADFPKEKDLKTQLTFLIGFAVLAPSGHNSQPWNFSIVSNKILFQIVPYRSLKDSDPAGKQLMIAFGCSLENLLQAASACGFKTEVQYLPKEATIAVLFESNSQEILNNFAPSITKRYTNRGPYLKKELPQDFLNNLFKYSQDDIRIFITTDKNKKIQLVDILVDSQIKAMDNSKFREELSLYIKSNFTKSKIGMPGFALGIPAFVSLFASKLIKKINLSKKSEKKDKSLFMETPAFITIASKNNNSISWIKSGQLFERIWLYATQEGLVCSPQAAPIQDQFYREKLQNIIETKFIPDVFFRIGYPVTKSLPSPRFLPEELIINNVSI
jgi:nitroreductase